MIIHMGGFTHRMNREEKKRGEQEEGKGRERVCDF